LHLVGSSILLYVQERSTSDYVIYATDVGKLVLITT